MEKIKKNPYTTASYVVYLVFIILSVAAYVMATIESFGSGVITLLLWIIAGVIFLVSFCINALLSVCENKTPIYNIKFALAIFRLIIFTPIFLVCLSGLIYMVAVYLKTDVWATLYEMIDGQISWFPVSISERSIVILLIGSGVATGIMICCILHEIKLLQNYSILKHYFRNEKYYSKIHIFPIVFRGCVAIFLVVLGVCCYMFAFPALCLFLVLEGITLFGAGLSVFCERRSANDPCIVANTETDDLPAAVDEETDESKEVPESVRAIFTEADDPDYAYDETQTPFGNLDEENTNAVEMTQELREIAPETKWVAG